MISLWCKIMAEIGFSLRLDALNRLKEDLQKGNIIDPFPASELVSYAIQELQMKRDEISALEEDLAQMTTYSAKFKAELDIERALMGEVFRQNPAGIVIMDAQSGKAIRVNMMSKKIMGRESVISRSVEDHNSGGSSVLFHLDGTPCDVEEMPIMRSVLQSEIVANEELIFNRVDGQQGVLNVSSGPIFDCYGKVIAAVSTFYDVTRKGYR